MKKIFIKTNNIITQKELENGLWQFMLDHARIYDKTLWRISFTCKNKDDFFRRVYSRATGLYKVKDEENILKDLEKKEKYFWELKNFKERCDEKEKLVQKLKKTNKYKYIIIIFLRRIINKILYSNEKTKRKIIYS